MIHSLDPMLSGKGGGFADSPQKTDRKVSPACLCNPRSRTEYTRRHQIRHMLFEGSLVCNYIQISLY